MTSKHYFLTNKPGYRARLLILFDIKRTGKKNIFFIKDANVSTILSFKYTQ